MGLFIEIVEYELKHNTLVRELEERRMGWFAIRPGRTIGRCVSRIVVDEASLGGVAPVLADIPSGAEQELELDGRPRWVGRTLAIDDCTCCWTSSRSRPSSGSW